MSKTKQDSGQVIQSAAEIYQEIFVPALFQEWAEPVLDAANVQEGQAVLDVACGTGVVTRSAQKRVGTGGKVIGLDINEGMLSVARKTAPHIEFQHGNIEDLPFPDHHFDAITFQFALMFIEDQKQALQEVMRVLRPERSVAIAVWGALEETPGYAKMVELLARLFGEEVANGLRAPYNLGDKNRLKRVLDSAGITDYEITTRVGTAHFPSIESWVFTDIKGWVLADSIDDDQYQLLLSEAQKELKSFVTDDGSVKFDAPAHIISISKS